MPEQDSYHQLSLLEELAAKTWIQSETPLRRLERHGERALSLTELLAVIIGSDNADDETLLLAQLIMQNFPTIHELAVTTPRELALVEGIERHIAGRIKASLELGRRLMHTPLEKRRRITTPEDAANVLIPELIMCEQEHLCVLLLNTRNDLLRLETIYIGSVNTTVVRISELFRPALRYNAVSIILAHNHPSGDPTPSPEDVRITREVVKAGELLGIDVLDHLVIGGNRFISLKERGLGFG